MVHEGRVYDSVFMHAFRSTTGSMRNCSLERIVEAVYVDKETVYSKVKKRAIFCKHKESLLCFFNKSDKHIYINCLIVNWIEEFRAYNIA